MRKAFADGVTLPVLAELKKVWKTSMIALLYPADDLGFLTYNQKRYLLQQFNSVGIRRREPVELTVPREQPALIRQWLAVWKIREGWDTAALHMFPEEFIQNFGE